MSIVRLLPAWLHAVADYAVAAVLILAAVLLLAAPFALHFNASDRGLTALYVGAGLAVLAVSLVTNYQYAPQRRVAPAAAAA
jgi:hypothetical protein